MPKAVVVVRPALPADAAQVLEMFVALWPDEDVGGHRAHIRGLVTGKPRSTLPLTLFVAESDGRLVGFAEVGLRSHANGCDPIRPVGFLEGWYVARGFRKRGVGRMLVAASEKWARAQGCREMASDTWTTQRGSIAAHQAIGFKIDDRCVNFYKSLR